MFKEGQTVQIATPYRLWLNDATSIMIPTGVYGKVVKAYTDGAYAKFEWDGEPFYIWQNDAIIDFWFVADPLDTDDDALWEASVYDVFEIEYTFNGILKHERWDAGKWNRFLYLRGEDDEWAREKQAVRAALAAEVQRRKDAGRKPNTQDREP